MSFMIQSLATEGWIDFREDHGYDPGKNDNCWLHENEAIAACDEIGYGFNPNLVGIDRSYLRVIERLA